MKKSTHEFYKEARKIPGFSLFDRIHAHVYGAWSYLYISVGKGEHPLYKILRPVWDSIYFFFNKAEKENRKSAGNWVSDTYHGKVLPVEEATKLVNVNREINVQDLEQVIPYPQARSIILKNPDHIVALECPCRASAENPCQPTDVCLIVGEPFAGFIIEHHPDRSRWITQKEAEDIIRAEHERGHVHHAFFKDAMLGRFYAICNCCSCCCGAVQAFEHGTPMLASSGFVSRVNPELCQGCEACLDYCQFHALELINDKAVVHENRCMGCGVCVSKCDYHAHELVRDPTKGIPLQINKLI